MIARIQNFYNRTQWLGRITGSQISAALLLITLKLNPNKIGHGTYKGFKFSFRKHDLSALKEVLIDAEYEFLAPFLNKTQHPVILDIGAHIGTFALWALSTHPKAQICSIEADPQTFKILESNIKQNQIPNWTCLNNAAWKNNDAISFSDSGDSMSHRVSDNGTVKISGITLPDILEKTGAQKIDLAKIDIEGAEEAFLCATPVMLEKIERLVIELHPALCSADKVRAHLQHYYPNIEEIQGRKSSKPLLYCWK